MSSNWVNLTMQVADVRGDISHALLEVRPETVPAGVGVGGDKGRESEQERWVG